MEQLSERVYLVPGGTNTGVIIADDGRAVVIDVGLNDTQARKLLRFVRDDLRTTIRAILTTHGHADHFGGNAWLVKRTDATVYAPDMEEMTLRFPLMQAIMLYGGADPVDAIRTSFLVAAPGPVHGTLQSGVQSIEGVEIECVPLAGHSINQMGIKVDDVFFCADVVFPAATLAKYPVPYLYGLTEHLESLRVAGRIDANTIVPGHGPAVENLSELVALNRAAIDRTIAAILDALASPASADDVCARVFTLLGVPVRDAQAFYLLRPTISAYLSHLEREGQVALDVADRTIRWRRA